MNGRNRHPQPLAMAISRLREAAGLSQQALARRMRTSQQAVSRLEQGRYEGYTLKTLRKVARAIHAELHIDFVPRRGNGSRRLREGAG